MSSGAEHRGVDVFRWTLDWAELPGSGLGLWSCEETGSTNLIAKNDTSAGAYPRLYVAKRQTQGRGRHTNQWLTPPGSSLLSSWCFMMDKVPQPIFAPLIGLALFEAARRTWSAGAFNMKAPNDLYVGDKKIAGLLIEIVEQGHEKKVVIGLGMNVSGRPDAIPESTCLTEHIPKKDLTEPSWASFLEHWFDALTHATEKGRHERLDDGARERIKSALNLHPLLREPILEVGPYGELVSAGQTRHWHDL